MIYTMLRFPQFRAKALTFSYDDGMIFDGKLVEILDKYGLKGTFNLNSGLFDGGAARRLTQEQALALFKNSPHEVAIHGRMHLHLPSLPPALAAQEILSDRQALEELFGGVITGMAYAYGTYDDASVQTLKNCGISYARTTVSTGRFDIPTDWLRMPATCHHDDARLMDLAKQFAQHTPSANWRCERPLLFYVWGHSYEFNDKVNWNVIEDFAAYLGGRDDVWYATNMEIYRYVKAYDALEFSSDGASVYNPSAQDVYLHIMGTDVVALAGKTTALR